jgi:ribosomal protein S18 acetylase RimI-like enzyme
MDRLTPQKAAEFARKVGFPPPFMLRLAAEGDIAAIIAIGRAAFHYNPPTRKEIRYYIEKAHGACFAITDSAGVCGYILLEGHMGRKSLYLNTIAIAERARGHGLGAAIYRALDQIAVDLGARGLYSHVRQDNAANIHLLEKCGFAFVRAEGDYYDDGAEGLLYRKTYR